MRGRRWRSVRQTDALLLKLMDSSIDLASAYANSGVADVLEQLDRELIGLKPIKTRIREIAALLLVDQARQQLDLPSTAPSLHMSFTGRPGTGKTTVAERMSRVCTALVICVKAMSSRSPATIWSVSTWGTPLRKPRT